MQECNREWDDSNPKEARCDASNRKEFMSKVRYHKYENTVFQKVNLCLTKGGRR